jgi:hypothetical protein
MPYHAYIQLDDPKEKWRLDSMTVSHRAEDRPYWADLRAR